MNTEHSISDITDTFRPDAHYLHLMNAIPSWLREAAPHRREALGKITPRMPQALKGAPKHHHAELGSLIAQQVTSQNRVDQALANLQNPAAFAEPLLNAALKTRFGLELDVSKTFLRLYIPTRYPWLRMKSGAARIWTVSLLDAVLHNFESGETTADAFESASTYITPPTANGQFNALPHILKKMPIAAFTHLCRELDMGDRYKKYLEDNLGISNPVAAAILKPKIRESQKTALSAALHMAQMQNLLSSDVHRLMRGLLDNLPFLRLRGQPWGSNDLTIMSARLTGIVVFAPDLERAGEVARVVAYIPDDPEHPIKEYPSSAAFAVELSQRLRNPDYQQFFSRFLNHEDRGHFFAQLNTQLAPITWQPVQPGDQRPTWRENPNQRPNLQMSVIPIRGELLSHLYQRTLDKILNDARVIAVSTASVDQKARWALWDSFTEIASVLLNVAAFIALPFVPFLGELMLAYMAYQLLDETFESIVDWAEGLTTEAFEHFMGVVQSAVQLGTFAAGGVIAVGEFRSVLPREIVQFIDRFNSVKLPNGKARYWKPDLASYEYSATLPKDLKTDALGLHPHQGKNLLTLEGNHYSVTQDSLAGQHRIEHPTRPDAYKPALKHNGAGAWQTELDQPLTWDQATVLRRIGPDMQRFSATERERMLTISGCHENALRKMHVNATQIPPLLADTLKRFKIDQDLQTFIERIGSERPDDYLNADPVTQLELLCDYGYWPAEKGLRLVDVNTHTVWERVATDQIVVQINHTQSANGDLLKTLLQTLGDTDARILMQEEFGAPSPSVDTRARTLRHNLAELAQAKREILFSQRYRKLEQSSRPVVQRVIDVEPGLPTSLAEVLLDSASAQERRQLEKGTLSKRLTELAQEAGLQVRVTRAYEGLELHSTRNNLDTDRLALHSLERLPGWPGQLRLEIRQYAHGGQLIDSIGNPNALARKVLVLTDEGNYQAYDAAGNQLSSGSTLYSSLLQALPDGERIALNINIGEGERLKQMIRTHAINRDPLRSLLAQHPNLKPTYDSSVMRLLGGSDGYYRKPTNTPTLQNRAHSLFPHLSPEELQVFVERLQRHPTGPRAELHRLFNQHAQLFDDLNAWRSEIPLFVPDTQNRVSPEQFGTEQQIRRQFMGELLDCWRRQATYDIADGQPVDFNFSQPILGDLPVLNVDFPQVRNLLLEGHRATRGVNEFLKGFSGINRLVLRNFNLGQLPEAIAQWPQLNELILSDCGVTLTAQSQASLAGLNNLGVLDLYKNPLGMLPSLQNLPNLNYVDLCETGLTDLPPGLLTRQRLRTALLNDNRITELPTALFNLPGKMQEGFDLGGNPISAAGRERIKVHFNQTRRDFGIFVEQTYIRRLQVLYPLMDQEEASEFIYRLPGTLAEGRIELVRLENEYETLRNDLAAWTAHLPPLHPDSGEPFTAQQLLIEHATRDEFKQLMERCWRRETELDDFNQDLEPSYELSLTTIIAGDLPVLTADFSHVSLLYLHSDAGLTTGAGRFLQCFPRLKSLTIREYNLREMPEAIFRMGKLTALALNECNVTLTAQTVLELAQLERLDYLDLSNNPLALTPDISQMPGMANLLLSETGINQLPAGLLQLKSLDVADLSGNAITHIPSDILELPLEIAESINLRDNPLDEQSVKTLIAYFKKTSTDFGVQAVIEQAEMEVSTSEDSDPDE
ncbi:dermonecrotic toxin domain-containing protein [Pseudomonas sp. PD9R]|uniref:dermonecrotic toxin domain-containing protein n=1 Tax=Pseudomonas sp. PD9R TaxID=2853534 RepID=UPI001C436C8A|nr:DUF6543 domain-containing protein [Pseudomonas sp. PD9R]MBV6827221.1 hypothetical protein [Pseudomonas sp. PD9R]